MDARERVAEGASLEVERAANRVKGQSAENVTRDYVYRGSTQSTCPECRGVVQARYYEKQNKLHLKKYCPEHGHSMALVSSDAKWTRWADSTQRPGQLPESFAKEPKYGCPLDCGLCSDHEQHSCFIQFEITDVCDMTCTNCYMGPQNKGYLSMDQIHFMLDKVNEYEGLHEVLTLTGGEPTLHPQFFEIAEAALKKNIKHVLINTNGNRIAKDPDFSKRMADMGLVCYLQFDGFDDDMYVKMRGRKLIDTKMQALENLEKANCLTALSPVIARGINEDQVGPCIKLALEKDFIKVVNFLTITYVKQRTSDSPTEKAWGEGETAGNAMDLVTLPEMHELAAAQLGGLLRAEDFAPVPCHHPSCGSVTYFVTTDDGSHLPLSKLIDVDPLIHELKNRSRVDEDGLLEATRLELRKVLGKSGPAARDKVLRGVQELVSRSCDGVCQPMEKSFDDALTQISVHCFMDAYSWDISRARKCCIHFMLPDGRVMPFCQYNIFHRDGHVDRLIDQIEGRVPCSSLG